MPTIKMLKDKLGSDNGYTTALYKKDEEYEVGDSLAESFIRDKEAVEIEGGKKATKPDANKATKPDANK